MFGRLRFENDPNLYISILNEHTKMHLQNDVVCVRERERERERHFETWHGERIKQKTLNVIVLHGIFLVTCANEDTIWFPLSFFLSLFFQKGGSLYKQETDWWMTIFCLRQ